MGEINYQFIGQSVSFDSYAFEFKNNATFTSSGAYTAKLTMIMKGEEYSTEEAVHYSSASGNYAVVGDILYFENGSENQEFEIVKLSANRMIPNATGSAALTGEIDAIVNI